MKKFRQIAPCFSQGRYARARFWLWKLEIHTRKYGYELLKGKDDRKIGIHISKLMPGIWPCQ